MCYELSAWFTKVRAAQQGRAQESKVEPVTPPPQRLAEPQSVASEAGVEERDTAPA